MTRALTIDSLTVALPDGRRLLENLDLTLDRGEVVVLLGGSGAGKSTFSRVLFERDELLRQGFTIETAALDLAGNQLCLVPQRGALFDHLDVRGNLELARRYQPASSKSPQSADPAVHWLENVGLSAELADRAVGELSGGQAQRVAVARALASEHKLLFLDEPSVGLDPHRVRMLSRLIRQQVETLGISVIVVTHDPALAAGVADRLYLLDPAQKNLRQLFADTWPGAVERDGVSEEERGRWLLDLERALIMAIAEGSPDDRQNRSSRGGWLGRWLRERAQSALAPFAIAGRCVVAAPTQLGRHPGDFLTITSRVLAQTLLRPLVFYGIVSVLIGFTVLFVISKVGGAGVRTDAILRQVGGSYVVALAPPLSAILFVAASGSATNAWLGSMSLTRQTTALEALGISKYRYLWGPTWLALAVSYLVVASLVAGGMLLGGVLLTRHYGMPNGLELLSADFFDPRPERAQYVGRALFLVWFYAWGIASDTLAKGGAFKSSADEVTRAMTGSVVACTLWVVAWELVTVLVVARG